MRSPKLVLALITLLCAAMPAHRASAQGTVPTVDLSKQKATRSKYALGRISSLQELPDGRVLVSDTKEQVYRTIDFSKGTVGLIDHPAGEDDSIARVSTIFRLPGDSIGLYDMIGRRVLHMSGSTVAGAFVPTPQLPARRFGTPIAIDPSGAAYYSMGERFDTVKKQPTGDASILRVAPGATAGDTAVVYRTRRADQAPNSPFMPYFYRDAVGIRQDGLVARVVADTYQVLWIRNGRETGRTGPLPFEKIPIPVAEQAAIKDSAVAQMRAMMAGPAQQVSIGAGGGRGAPIAFGIGAGGPISITDLSTGRVLDGVRPGVASSGGSAGGATPPPQSPADIAAATAKRQADMRDAIDKMAAQPQGTFPEFKPPMPAGGNPVMFDANGMLWIGRERAHGDLVPHYDVVAEGKGLVAHINLPVGGRIIGFGKNAVYLVHTEDGSDWIDKYPLPKM